jgi:two-component system chemotaxis sensor kinase CheA
VTSPQPNATPEKCADEILSLLAEELAFVEPGKETGLLPINSLVMDLEELPRETAPAAFGAGIKAIRGLLDQMLDGNGTFNQQAVAFLNQWHPWMSAILTAWKQGAEPPPVPADWNPADASAPGATDEPAIRLNLSEDSELLREFHSESLELLQTIEQGVLVLEQNPAEAGTINSIFRAFHTFKGGAGLLHLDAVRDLAHDLESLLDAVRRGDLPITAEIINLIFAGGDTLKQVTREIGEQLQGANAGAPIVVASPSLRQRVKAAVAGENLPTAAPAAQTAASAGASAAVADSVLKVESATGFVKLDTRKLDSLVDLVGELVITHSMVVQHPDVRRSGSDQLVRTLRQLGRITSELQRTAMSLRMVPIGRTFQKMTRLVRDLAAQQGKQAQLVMEGEETELDRNIVEQLSDPLVHMIRNSLDHGIEPTADRIARGKPAAGMIRLSATHQRGGIVIQIQDDGKGLDRDRILAKARASGLINPGDSPTDPEIFALIFAPGFSTAEKVTDVSGRGVGMDVVQRHIEKLRGKVEIQSVAGQGTTFTIVLPLTLAIIDGMLVGVGDDRYIIPTLSVRESFRPRPGMVSTVHERGEVVSVRGKLTPLLRLGQHLGTPGRAVDPTEGIIVVVESGDAARGLLVDELLGKQEVVIKNLGETFRKQDLLAGAAILGDGRVGLILDVDTLVKCQPTSNPANGGRSS